MHYIKIGLWIFILSLFYATGVLDIFGTNPALLMIFALTYSSMAKTFAERITVALICGIFMSALGNANFALSVLFVLYFSLLAGVVFKAERIKYSYFVVLIIFFANLCFEGFSGLLTHGLSVEVLFETIFCSVVNFGFSLILYPMIRYTFRKKERYIFEEI